MASEKPIGRKPGFFLLIALLHGLLALLLIPTLLFVGLLIIFGDGPQVEPSVGAVVGGLFFALLVEFIAIMAISFLAQFFNALTMFGRALRTTSDASLGSYANHGRYVELLPHRTTPWSRFWVDVQQHGWRQWRILLAIFAIILLPFVATVFPLRSATPVFLAFAVVLLSVAGYFIVAQTRLPKPKRKDAAAASDAYAKGLAARERKRARDLAAAKEAAVSGPAAFDAWVDLEIDEAFRQDPWAIPAIRKGDLDAMAGPVRAAFIALDGAVSPERLRELALARATRKRRSPAARTKPAAPAAPASPAAAASRPAPASRPKHPSLPIKLE